MCVLKKIFRLLIGQLVSNRPIRRDTLKKGVKMKRIVANRSTDEQPLWRDTTKAQNSGSTLMSLVSPTGQEAAATALRSSAKFECRRQNCWAVTD